MAVTITKEFYNSTDTQWDAIAKIVFTSPNIASPAAAGTRSHILPGSEYIGTWYESVSNMHRINRNQNSPLQATYSGILSTTYFNEFYLYNTDFTLGSGTTVTGISTYNLDPFFDTVVDVDVDLPIYFSKDDRARAGSVTSSGVEVSLSGTTYWQYTFDGIHTPTGSGVFSGGTTTISGSDKLYSWIYNHTVTSGIYAVQTDNSILFRIAFGEAYNCRLTAWDDVTHTTTNNKILDEGHYKATCLAYKAGRDLMSNHLNNIPAQGISGADVTTWVDDLLRHPPEVDLILKGNDSYYGDFDLIHVADGGVTGQEEGDYLLFQPRLDDMNETFTSGNYDFVTTLHYQYT